MKKSLSRKCVDILLSFAFFFTLTSCLSIPKSSGYEIKLQDTQEVIINLEKIDVFCERLSEPSIANQISEIIKTMIPENTADNTKKLDLRVAINQRSFLKNITQKNSIYVSYTLTDPVIDKVYLNKGCYFESDSTLVSSIEQYRIAKIINNGIKNFK